MANNQLSWLEKYRPKKLVDYYISKKQLDVVKIFFRDFRNKTDDIKSFLVLYGPPGIGKTTLAHLILEYYDYEIIECNASDTRTKKTIHESIGQISKTSVCIDEKNQFKQTAIIMDEIDGLSGGESNSVQELIDIVTKDKDSKKNDTYLCPVVCTTNSIKDKKLAPLLKQAVVLNLNKPSEQNCIKLIDKILLAENFNTSEEIKNDIITKAYGDYRQIIMLLFQYYHNLQIIKKNNIYPYILPAINIDICLDIKANINSNINANITLIHIDDELNNNNIIKQISNVCETPLEKINYFLTHNTNFENIRNICSDDSNLYYMNFYINIINIINSIQIKEGLKTKESLLSYYKLLYNVYNSLKNADLLNNTIFLDKNWEMLDYFDTIGLALPMNILYRQNLKNNNSNNNNSNNCKYFIQDFQLTHHTQYNFMRQEQALIRKKLNIDYGKTHDIDLINLYYNLKRFKHINKDAIIISDSRSKKKKSLSDNENNKFQINKTYLKIVDKIDELLK